MEIFPGIDLKVKSREDVQGWYTVKIHNKKLNRETTISTHASIGTIADCVNNIIKLRNAVFATKFKRKA